MGEEEEEGFSTCSHSVAERASSEGPEGGEGRGLGEVRAEVVGRTVSSVVRWGVESSVDAAGRSATLDDRTSPGKVVQDRSSLLIA